MVNNVIKNVTLSNGNKADLNAKYWNGKETLKTINGNSLFGSGDISITSTQLCVPYDELKDLRDYGKLIPGQQYRITDYVTTTSQENTESAGHQFDIIVTALNEYTLCEEAHVIQNQDDDYFDECNLEAWKIWYCINNDTDRFSWANYDEGKGVIYRMIDEFGNDCPYDFKNIKFLKPIISETDTQDPNYYYTFCYYDGDIIEDASVFINNNRVFNNVIKQYLNIRGQHLNRILFIGEECLWYDNTLGSNCFDNIFEDGCNGNTFGNNCYSNKLGSESYSNTLGNNCFNNIFGDECHNNILGNNCYNNELRRYCNTNTFGNNCYSNKLGSESYSNTLGDKCFSNTFNYDCNSNILGKGCNSNTFGGECYFNILGSNCNSNIFGSNCNSNTFGNDCYRNEFGDDCASNTFSDGCYENLFIMCCGSNTFGNNCYGNTFGEECFSNTFGDDCFSNELIIDCDYNTFGNSCHENILTEYCNENTFGDGCDNNSFGSECVSNTFGSNCSNNTFGDNCYENKLGNNCYENKFGNSCYSNEFGNCCHDNTFDEDCNRNTFGSDCSDNTFGNEFDSNSFGNNCTNINFGNSCCYNSFGNGCFNIVFSQPNGLIPYLNNIHFGDRVVNIGLVIDMSEESLNHNFNLKNVNVTQGFNSSNEEYVEINMDEYVGITDKEITITKDHEGNVRVFCLADVLAQHGFI